MTDESLLKLMKDTNLNDCKEIVPGYVYHYRRRRNIETECTLFHLYDG